MKYMLRFSHRELPFFFVLKGGSYEYILISGEGWSSSLSVESGHFR